MENCTELYPVPLLLALFLSGYFALDLALSLSLCIHKCLFLCLCDHKGLSLFSPVVLSLSLTVSGNKGLSTWFCFARVGLKSSICAGFDRCLSPCAQLTTYCVVTLAPREAPHTLSLFISLTFSSSRSLSSCISLSYPRQVSPNSSLNLECS